MFFLVSGTVFRNIPGMRYQELVVLDISAGLEFYEQGTKKRYNILNFQMNNESLK